MAGKIPHIPMFNIPETFGKTLSYEGQIHAIFDKYNEQIESINDTISVLEDTIENIIPDGGVTTPKIADGAVTSLKLANESVTNLKLANATRTSYVRCFENVADMQYASDLIDGMICRTDGFHASDDGGAAYYTISTNGTANGIDVLACANGLYATLVITEYYVTPEMFGAYNDGSVDCAGILNHILTNYELPIIGSGDYLVNDTVVLSGDRTLELNGDVTSTLNKAAFQVVGLLNNLKVYKFTNNDSNGVFCLVGGNENTSRNYIFVQECRVPKNIPFVIGSTMPVWEIKIEGQYLEYGINAFKFDLSTKWVGQIEINGFRISLDPQSTLTTAWAFDIDCQNAPMTGLIMNDISMEGSKGGIHAYNTTENRRFETLQISNIRLAEFAASQHYCFLKLEGTGPLYGNCFTDWIYDNTFDFSNHKPTDPNSFFVHAGNIILGGSENAARGNWLSSNQNGFIYRQKREKTFVGSGGLTENDYMSSRCYFIPANRTYTINFDSTKKNIPESPILILFQGAGSFIAQVDGNAVRTVNVGSSKAYLVFFHHISGLEVQMVTVELNSFITTKIFDITNPT